MRKLIFTFSLIMFLVVGFEVRAATVGGSQNFYIQPDYDLKKRSEITATLVKFTPELYFYVDQDFWYTLAYHQQNELRNALDGLAKEFKEKIYPTLTNAFGAEWKPGIDKDEKITVLFHPMLKDISGYFNSGDEYPKIQVSNSNQREMVYLNSQYIEDEKIKPFLAHEFMHLIGFNQKEKEYNVSEEVWLNEARSEYVSTLLGYSNLEIGNPFRKRLEVFIENPNDSLCEWQNKEADYGAISLFTHYLVDHYGIEILVDSLHSEKIGIESLNYALKKNGFKEDFSQIFTDWTVAVLVGDCSFSEKYCYKNENLKNFRVSPSLNFLPLNGKSSLVVTNTTKNWSGNWFNFVGGRGDLEVRFVGSPENIYRVPYLTKDFSGNWKINFFELNSNQGGEISIPEFGTKIISVIIIPSLQTKVSDFFGQDTSIPFFLEASTIAIPAVSISLEKPILEMSKTEILAKISELEELLNQLKSQLQKLIGPEEILPEEKKISYPKFEENLYYGQVQNEEVKHLQEFLCSLGAEIYPEGLVTGNFLGLTQKAVIHFQEKYATEILTPLGIEKGTGFVGPSTRDKINQILGY